MKQPTILFITTDEQHLDTVYREDMPYDLPALRQLMAQSDVYANAYSASPVCLPARCTWMTGLMPHRNGCISNNYGATLPLQLPNLFTSLKQGGYTTSLHGKCHFVPCPYPAVRKHLTQEYEHFRVYYKALGMDHLDLQDDKNISLWYYDDYSTELEKKGLLSEYRDRFMTSIQPNTLPDYPHDKRTHPDAWTGEKALAYLEQCRADDPHFMWISFSGPHYPMDAPTDYNARVDMQRDIPRRWREGEWDDKTKQGHMGYWGTGPATEGSGSAIGHAQKNYTEEYWTRWREKYYANIVQIDEYIGRIIEKAQGIWGEDLYIVFTADHGDMMGNHSLWGKNTSLYDDVLRVPLVIHHPGQEARRDVPHTVSSVDVFPTLLQMGACDLPEDIDGAPLADIEARGGRDVILSSCEGRVAIVRDGIKICINSAAFEPKPGDRIFRELYDLRCDPYEFENLYEDPAYAAQRDQLEALLEAEPYLLRTVFYEQGDRPYWFNGGEGAGYLRNRLV